MAKAKNDSTKTDSTPAGAAAKPAKAPAKKAAADAAAPAASARPAAAAKKSAPATKAAAKSGAPAPVPLIDTGLAAAAAAAMVAHRSVLGSGGSSAASSSGPSKESSTFRQLKENLANPAGNTLGGLIGTGPVQQKKAQSHGPDRQVGRNQTFGADVSRASVPRRTGG
jgi:hypothetical protein